MSGKPLAVYISPGLAPRLDDFPAEVVALHPDPGIYDLSEALAERGLRPDLIIQDEALISRTLLKGLESFDCPKVFWSLDPHLNHYWQAPYCALFDAVAVTQKDWIKPLSAASAARVEWITWFAECVPWVPFAARANQSAFVGRITGFRPVRKFFVEYLSGRFPLRVETDVPYDQVQAVYADARIAPDESIQGEITERLFKAAGAGCLVLEPRSGNSLEELFEPGREVLVYGDALELAEIMERLAGQPGEAERLGRAARERVAREHLPGHRLQALGRLALESPAAAPRGAAGEHLFWLAAARCLESGHLAAHPGQVIQGLAAYQQNPDCLTAILRLLAMGGQVREALEVAMRYASEGFAHSDPGFMTCACALALRLDEFPLAARLYQAFVQASGDPAHQAPGPAQLYAALAQSLARRDMRQRPGFPFDKAVHLPATASEMYSMSLSLDPDNQSVLRKAESLLRDLPGNETLRLGLLSELSLRSGEDYRLGLALGLADLRTFRVRQGLEELRLAREQARSRGREQSFLRLLADQDPRGLIRAAL
jgi:hypothetical protein